MDRPRSPYFAQMLRPEPLAVFTKEPVGDTWPLRRWVPIPVVLLDPGTPQEPPC